MIRVIIYSIDKANVKYTIQTFNKQLTFIMLILLPPPPQINKILGQDLRPV